MTLFDGRLKEPTPAPAVSTKSSRDTLDTKAAEQLGTACTRGIVSLLPLGKVLDVPKGGW
jgi:hypothetical protein